MRSTTHSSSGLTLGCSVSFNGRILVSYRRILILQYNQNNQNNNTIKTDPPGAYDWPTRDDVGTVRFQEKHP